MGNTILTKRGNHIVAKGDNPRGQKGQSRVAFPTSDKSQLVELCRWLHENPLLSDPFKDAEIRRKTNHLNYQVKFEDIMLVKR